MLFLIGPLGTNTFYENLNFLIQENTFDNVIWKMAILPMPQCVNALVPWIYGTITAPKDVIACNNTKPYTGTVLITSDDYFKISLSLSDFE